MSQRTAALLIIGNEILSGRTKDENTSWVAAKLCEAGIVLREVRVVPDIEERIVSALNEMRVACDYMFTTGGIGPTHDDITTQSVSVAMGVKAVPNEEAREALLGHYKSEVELTPARLRMAQIPEGARLISNPVSGAPGFIIENVHVMAGVPRIMQAMLDEVIGQLEHGAPILSKTIVCGLAESDLADPLSNLQDRFPEVDIGSYPSFRSGELGVSVVVRSTDKERIDAVVDELKDILESMGEEPRVMSFTAGGHS